MAVVGGLLLGSYLPFVPLLAFFVLIGLGLTLWLIEANARLSMTRATAIYAAVMFGLLYWTLVADLRTPRPLPQNIEARALPVTGTVVQPVQYRPDRVVLVLDDLEIGRGRAMPRLNGLLRLSWHTPGQGVGQGDRLAFWARLREPAGTRNFGGFDYAEYLKRRGIRATASVSGPEAVQVLASPS
ncbi:MAG: ComEC/Rec2 family competence protein, partial [Nitrospirales bacterium]